MKTVIYIKPLDIGFMAMGRIPVIIFTCLLLITFPLKCNFLPLKHRIILDEKEFV